MTVTAEAVTRESDRFVVSVGDGPAFAGRDGEELLRLAPGVRIGDEGISVNGASGTQVYVDGRKLKGLRRTDRILPPEPHGGRHRTHRGRAATGAEFAAGRTAAA